MAEFRVSCVCDDVTRMWLAAERGSSTTDSYKMADDLEHEDGKNTENTPETEQNDENMVNGHEDDSEFEDPEGFVDDISDEGRIKSTFSSRIFEGRLPALIKMIDCFESVCHSVLFR